MIKKKKIIGAYYLTPACDICGSEDFWNGEMLMSNPPVLKTYCKQCGRLHYFSEPVNRIEYVFEGENYD